MCSYLPGSMIKCAWVYGGFKFQTMGDIMDKTLEQFVGSRNLVLIVHIKIFSLSFHL